MLKLWMLCSFCFNQHSHHLVMGLLPHCVHNVITSAIRSHSLCCATTRSGWCCMYPQLGLSLFSGVFYSLLQFNLQLYMTIGTCNNIMPHPHTVRFQNEQKSLRMGSNAKCSSASFSMLLLSILRFIQVSLSHFAIAGIRVRPLTCFDKSVKSSRILLSNSFKLVLLSSSVTFTFAKW